MIRLHRFAGTLGALVLALNSIPSLGAELSAGGYHVVRIDGEIVKGLGDGTYGQLGTSPDGAPATVAGLSGITDVAAGGFSTLALKSDGTVWFLGEITLPHTTPHGTPDPVSTPLLVAGLAGIDAIAAGHRHFLALDTDTGNLYAWGHNGSGQCGNGGLVDVPTPVVVLTGVASMSAGDGFSLAVKSDQTLWAWGRNTHGQLGLGDTADRLSPTQVAGVTTAEKVAAGGQHSLILLTGGTVLAAGNNNFGQLGFGTTASTPTPTAVPGLNGVTAVSAGYFHSAAFSAAQVSVWGRNFEGQCGGDASSPVTYTSPQLLAGLSGTPTGVHCGYHFTLVELADGSVAGTGSNSDGQLDGSSVAGPGDSKKVLSPQILPLTQDATAPAIQLLNPADGATGVSTSASLSMTFNEPVAKGTGQIRIKENLGNEPVAAIDITSGSVTVANGQVTIGLPAVLGNGTAYYVEIDGGAIVDLSGNNFAGIAGSTTWSFTTVVASAATASLIAHYPFDVANSGSTPDAIGANSATLGNRVQIATTVSGRIGGGALEMKGGGVTQGPGDGAVTTNNFSWINDARTVTFWWRAKDPNTNTADGTFVSFGTEPANGARFDIKEQNASSTLLRVEVQGHGSNSNPAGFDNGNWHFVAVTVPNGATFADIAWFAGVRGGTLSGDINTSTNTLAIATGTGPLAFGDSIVSTVTSPTASNDRVPNGYLDDFQLYDEVLTTEQITFLYHNPGSVIGTPIEDFDAYISDPAFGLAAGEQGFGQDPDGDNLANGLEAWFGTHPGEPSQGLATVAFNGTITTFTHPQNPDRPTNVAGFYQWSPDLTAWYAGDGVDGPPGGQTVFIAPVTTGTTTTVTATASDTMERIFLRAGVTLLPSP